MRDLANSITVKRAISPAAAVADNTPIVSQIVDRSGFDKMMFAIITGALADADATFAVKVEHGNDAALADATEASATELTGTEAAAGFTFADDDSTRKIGYVGSKRYVRMTITPAANAGNAFIAAVAILSGGRYAMPA